MLTISVAIISKLSSYIFIVIYNNNFFHQKEFRKVAQLNNLVVRVGCFCNLGACQNALKFTDDDVLSSHEAGHVCGDDMDTLNGKPIGSIRVSFGYYSTKGITLDKIAISR